MPSFSNDSEKKRNKTCLICNKRLNDIISSPDNCQDCFHYKCLRNYIDSRLDNKKSIKCPEKSCRKIFSRISNKFKNSPKIIYQNVIIPIDENQCGICFSKYQIPVASPDSCSHTFCFDCIKKWCTYKQECPMDRVPIKMLSLSDFPGGHITGKSKPPAVEQDLSAEGDNDELSDMACEVCHSGQNEHQLLLCDSCDRGYHIYCLPVPLRMIPEGDWFCGDCITVENDDNAVPGRRMPRGLGRVVNNLQTRLPQVNLPFNHRRTRYERILAARRSRVNEPIFSSEDESDSEHSETEDELITRNRTNGETRRGRGRPIRNRIISRGQSENRRRNTQRTRGGRSVNNGGQGSLTSDIESGSEPRRKKRKLNISEDDDDEEEDGQYMNMSEDTEPDCSTPIGTRLSQSTGSTRVKSAVTKNNDVKNLKKIKEEEEEDDDDEDNLNTRSQKRRLIVETDPNGDECVRKRIRPISTSSSSLLPPKPCRISEQIEDITASIFQQIQNSRMKKKTMVRKSSTTDCNISEIKNEAGTSNGKSSNSRKKRKIKKTKVKKKIIKKGKIVYRRPRKIKRLKMLKRKTTKKSFFANTISTRVAENKVQRTIRRMVLPNELSLLGGKNYFPSFDDDNDNINKIQATTSSSTNQSSVKSPFKLNVSLLSDIDNSQNNLRNMTLSTIQRLPDGTLIYKQKETETAQTAFSQSNVQKNDLVKTVKNDNSKEKNSVELNNNVDIIDNQKEKIGTSKIKPNSLSFINSENCNMDISNKNKVTESINNTNFKTINNIVENFNDFDQRQNCSSRIDTTSKNINKISEKNNCFNKKSMCSLDVNNNHISNIEDDSQYNVTSKDYNKIIVEKDTIKEKEKEIDKSDNTNYRSSDKSVTHKHIENHLPTINNKSINSQLSIIEKKIPQNIEIFETLSMLGDEKPTSFEKVVVDNPKSILLDRTLTREGECSSSSTSKSKAVLPVPPPLQGNSTVDTVRISKNEIVKCISSVLNKFFYGGEIDKAEYKSIIKRIIEKIEKKNHSHHEKKIKAFVIEYMNFYLSKKKPVNLN